MNTQLATTGNIDPFAHLAKVAHAESGGAILKFTKGEWSSGDKPLNGSVLLADMAGLAVGWRKWCDGRIAASNVGLVAEGFQPANRDELSDTDQADWPFNKNGERADPWQFGYYLRLTDEDGNGYSWPAI